MDFYRDYIQTNFESEVNRLKKRGYQVVNIHTHAEPDRDEYTVFTLGLSYETAYKQLMSIVKDIEELFSKEELFEKIGKKFDEDYNEYTKNAYFETENEFTNWMATYEKVVHDTENTYLKNKKDDGEFQEDAEDASMPF